MRMFLSVLLGLLILIGVLAVTAFNVRGTAAQASSSVYLPIVVGQPAGPSPSVSLVNFAFQPTPLHVPVGATVLWTNTTPSTPHTVTADSGAFDSMNLNPGAKFSFTFPTAGTYNYHCQYHQSIGMVGSIVVGP